MATQLALQLLLVYGASVDAAIGRGLRVLHLAAHNGHTPALQLLLDRAARTARALFPLGERQTAASCVGRIFAPHMCAHTQPVGAVLVHMGMMKLLLS